MKFNLFLAIFIASALASPGMALGMDYLISCARIKERIKQESRAELLKIAQSWESGITTNSIRHFYGNSRGAYTMDIRTTDTPSGSYLTVVYTYNCDNTQETVQISVKK